MTENYYSEHYIISTLPKEFTWYKYITFDTEALRYAMPKGEYQKFYNVDFYDGENHYYSEKIDDVIKIISNLQKKYKKITLFAHNMSYDLRITHLLKEIIQNKFLGLYNSARLLDKIIFVKFADNHRHNIIQFVDSMNYFNASLSKLSSLISDFK